MTVYEDRNIIVVSLDGGVVIKHKKKRAQIAVRSDSSSITAFSTGKNGRVSVQSSDRKASLTVREA